MNREAFIVGAVVLALQGVAGGQPYSTQLSDPTVTGVVKVADQIKLPAQEPGVLRHLDVKEGSQVRRGQVIGKIDDREINTQMEAAKYAYGAAVKKYEDDVDIRYSDAAAAAAKADYEVMQGANSVVDRAITDVEMRAAKLNWDKMVLAAEKARKERTLAGYDAQVKRAEFQTAKLASERRTIVAPFDGVVEELARKQDEWVNPGDMILRMFRMDTMQVEGAVDQTKYDPHEIQNCEVTVEVKMARDRTETFRGRITKVSSLVRGDQMYNVRAEIENRQEHGSWMLRDGLPATMTIHLGTGGTEAATASGVRRAP
jgi:multidrug efflux pump subunit AcrA (membrane-fusion protein)